MAVSECGGFCVCDSHEGRVRFEADSAIVVRVIVMWATGLSFADYGMGVDGLRYVG